MGEIKFTDKRVGSGNRPRMTGHEGERISDFFDFENHPHKMAMKVTRAELLAILDRWHRVNREQKWYRRFWRFLNAPRGSGPVIVATVNTEQKPLEEPQA